MKILPQQPLKLFRSGLILLAALLGMQALLASGQTTPSQAGIHYDFNCTVLHNEEYQGLLHPAIQTVPALKSRSGQRLDFFGAGQDTFRAAVLLRSPSQGDERLEFTVAQRIGQQWRTVLSNSCLTQKTPPVFGEICSAHNQTLSVSCARFAL